MDNNIMHINCDDDFSYLDFLLVGCCPTNGSPTLLAWATGNPACKKLGVGGDDLTGALHVL